MIFVDLRDEYGVTQVVFHDDALLKGVRKESVISVTGKVVCNDYEFMNLCTVEQLQKLIS